MTSATLGKVLYGSVFVLVVPALLALWAAGASTAVHLPVPLAPGVGVLLAVVGVGLAGASMLALRVHGGGLPMNAFPAPRYVARGPYALMAHPIYTGFVVACAGASIAAGSASGLWLVTPAAALGCAALVLGYERIDLRGRFGEDLPRPWLSLPPATVGPPRLAERLSAWFLVLLPWAIAYLAVASFGPAPDARSSALPLETGAPVLEWTEAAYGSIYPVVLLAPLVARTRADLRAFMADGLLAMALVFPLYLAVPLVAPPRPFVPHDALGRLLELERACDTPAAAFPSFHVIWALLAARTYASAALPRGGGVAGIGRRLLAWGWGLGVVASCWTTGMHTLADIAAGVVAYFAVTRANRFWEWGRWAAERVANSWKEWHVGKARIINHGLYAGLAAFVGFAVMLALVGHDHVGAVAAVAAGGLVGSGIWAQVVEGSARLSRPYGFFGGLLGMCLCALASPWFGVTTWSMLAAACVAGPFTQSLGRLRCLVQGCCHGSLASPSVGIRYCHARSRVVRLSDLGGIPVHPTPLYSILWNVFIELTVARLWLLHARMHLIGGIYLVLVGLGRFVEEAYRGEPQTPVYARLRLYQWVSVGVATIGAACTALGRSDPAPAVDFHPGSLLPAIAFGIVTCFAMGVDFPASNRRLSRLA
jgi:protein-S-isoprenylcysteine O-methyltransferase Ste14